METNKKEELKEEEITKVSGGNRGEGPKIDIRGLEIIGPYAIGNSANLDKIKDEINTEDSDK